MKRALLFVSVLLIACSFAAPATAQDTPPVPHSIVFVGNSLTYGRIHETWQGGWGMAASQPDRDYVHRTQLLIAARTGIIPEIAVASLDLIYPQHFAAAQELGRTFPADVLVIELGDAAQQMTEAEYKGTLRQVIGWFTYKRLVITGVWYVARLEQWNQELAQEYGAEFVPLHDLNTPEHWQIADCAAPGTVCDHPGDAGMAAIAERVTAAILGSRTAMYVPWLETGR